MVLMSLLMRKNMRLHKTFLISLLATFSCQADENIKIHPIASHHNPVVEIVNSYSQPMWNPQAPDGDVILNAAIHITAQQCPDGGFGWPHDTCASPSPQNTTGPIMRAIRHAWKNTELPVFMDSMLKAGDYNLSFEYANNTPRFGTMTPFWLWNLTHESGDSIYQDFTESGFFSALEAGTYGSGSDMDTQEWIASVESARTGAWVNLRPWEFTDLILVSQRHCRNIQSGMFENAIYRGLGTLDNTDPDNVYSDLIGVTGGAIGLASVNRLSFAAINAPLHGGINGIDSLEALADYLASQQNADGSWYWHSNLAAPSESDKDGQTTAYAIIALIKANERLPNKNYLPAIQLGQEWLLTLQDSDGGFFGYPGDTGHNTEVEGEIVDALGTVGVYDRIFGSGLECYIN
jgi:hypothetical protein